MRTPTSASSGLESKAEGPIKIQLQNLTPKEVARHTGFVNVSRLFSFILVLCGGDIEVLTCTASTMTWLEEWLLYLEITYGQAWIRWEDIEVDYALVRKSLQNVFRIKISLHYKMKFVTTQYDSNLSTCHFLLCRLTQ
jgi:hypothetical protein